jgi:hypothetical protein
VWQAGSDRPTLRRRMADTGDLARGGMHWNGRDPSRGIQANLNTRGEDLLELLRGQVQVTPTLEQTKG